MPHAEQCATFGLSYSARIRPGTKQLTGLYCVRIQDYFPQVRPIMERNLKLLARNEFHGSNEELIYRMMEEAFGLPTGRQAIRPHHGVRLRVWECGARTASELEPALQATLRKHALSFVDNASSPTFQSIVQRLTDIPYSKDIAKHQAYSGPGAVQQFHNALLVCGELINAEFNQG